MGMISDYTFSDALSGETTWEADTAIDGWIGLQMDNTDAASRAKNMLFKMQDEGTMDHTVFLMDFPSDQAPSITFGMPYSELPREWIESTSSSSQNYWGTDIIGFMTSDLKTS